MSESKELVILASQGIVVRAERFCQKGWFVASALEHNSWLISGASRRDRWFVAFALEHVGLINCSNAERHSKATSWKNEVGKDQFFIK